MRRSRRRSSAGESTCARTISATEIAVSTTSETPQRARAFHTRHAADGANPPVAVFEQLRILQRIPCSRY
jgi:hypothetical protein